MEKEYTITLIIKRRTVLIVTATILAVLLLILAGKVFLKSQENGTLVVRGRIVTDLPLAMDPPQQHMVLPAVAVLEELGYTTERREEDVVLVIGKDDVFELNLENGTLYETGNDTGSDYFTPPPGFYYSCCYRNGDDLMIDVTTFSSALVLMDSRYRVADNVKYRLVVAY